jgi:pimeloyl-ACP methyl ester carboxylesterase
MVSRVQPGSFHQGHLSPVLIIPGVYENWQFMMPLIRSIHDAGHPVHVVTVLQRNKLDVPVAARLVAQHLEEAGLRDAAIVAHSKGGLIGKYAMLNLDPEGRISRMITVCTPFSGSRYAKYMLLPSLRIFSPSNALTLQLAREEAINSRITSIYGPFDPHIPEGSVLPGATNIELPTAGHFRILGDHETARIIVEQLTPDEP